MNSTDQHRMTLHLWDDTAFMRCCTPNDALHSTALICSVLWYSALLGGDGCNVWHPCLWGQTELVILTGSQQRRCSCGTVLPYITTWKRNTTWKVNIQVIPKVPWYFYESISPLSGFVAILTKVSKKISRTKLFVWSQHAKRVGHQRFRERIPGRHA